MRAQFVMKMRKTPLVMLYHFWTRNCVSKTDSLFLSFLAIAQIPRHRSMNRKYVSEVIKI